MQAAVRNSNLLNDSLKVFFKDALRITLTNPIQAFYFFRTVNWLRKAAQLRAGWKKQNILVPPIIIFSITNKCNLACKGCYAQALHDQAPQELSPEKLRQITAEAKELGVSFFVLAGGEPFMRPEMLDIIEDYPEIIFLIFTNGLLINDAMIQRFRKQRNVVPLVSLEGDQTSTDERRGPGTFTHVQNIMQQMKKYKLFFGTSLTLTRQNFAEIIDYEYSQKLVKLGCKFFLYLEYTPVQEGTEDLTLTGEQRNQFVNKIKLFRSEFPALFIGVPWDEEDVGGCLSAGRGFVHINAWGDIEPCPFAPFSDTDVRNSSLKAALQSDFLKLIRENPEFAEEKGGGCVLWQKRHLVQALLEPEKPLIEALAE